MFATKFQALKLQKLLPFQQINVFSSFATKFKKDEPIVPVKLAYNSYENTQSTETNDPPPLLIMHGLFGSKSNWNSLSKALHQKTVPQRRIIAVDARNHGDSPHTEAHSYEHLVEDMRALLEQLNIGKTAVMGHSMGGRAMMLLALKHPELIDKLIVADISPITTSPNLKTMPVLVTAMQRIQLLQNVPITTVRYNADLQLSSFVSDAGVRSFLLTNLIKRDDGSYMWRVNLEALKINFEEHIAKFPEVENLKFEGPVLFLGGGASDFIQKSDHPAILKLFPNAEFKYIEGAGHWLHSEKPKEFLQACTEFLNKQPANAT